MSGKMFEKSSETLGKNSKEYNKNRINYSSRLLRLFHQNFPWLIGTQKALQNGQHRK